MAPVAKIILLAIFVFVGSGLITVFLLSQKPTEVPSPHISTKTPRLQASPEASTATSTQETQMPPPEAAAIPATSFLHNYIEIVDSCGPHYEGSCVNIRSGASTSSPVIEKLRTGIVLAVATDTIQDASGNKWYRVIFDEWLRYPERVSGNMYVSADSAQFFQKPIEAAIAPGATTTIPSTKSILVDRTTQMLYAYDGDTLFMQSKVSTGLELTPTPRGVFTVYMKTSSRYMQGPVPGISDQYYDLPGVPWDLYFTAQGGAIHGAYWHNEFGQEWSHGCVNLPLDAAKKLYDWADVGTKVTVRD